MSGGGVRQEPLPDGRRAEPAPDLRAIHYTFRDEALEAAFQAATWPAYRRRVRRVVLLASALILLGLLAHVSGLQRFGDTPSGLALRAVALVALAVIFLECRRPTRSGALDVGILAATLAAVAAWLLPALLTDGEAQSPAVLIAVLALLLLVPQRYPLALTATLAFLAAVGIQAVADPSGTKIEFSLVLAAAGAFAIFNSREVKIASRRRFLAQHQVQALTQERDRATTNLTAALANMDQALLVIDQDQRVVTWSPRFLEVFALDPSFMEVGKPFSSITARLSEAGLLGRRGLDESLHDRITTPRAGDRLELPLTDGRFIDVRRNARPGGGLVITYTDITDRKRSELLFRRQAELDGLTGVINRAAFLARLESLLSDPSNAGIAVLLLDLDHFKVVNDQHGHASGDVVLKAVTERLRRALRENDLIGRLGGDEFVAALPDIATRHDVLIPVQRILVEVARPISVDGLEVTVGVSIGIALCPADGTQGRELLERADAAMYAAKSDARGYAFASREALDEPDARGKG
ncbi:MAG: diguanylate cyclase [Alphaproteobacteria bacterium]|nr:diguanylate cyclase [Alphaproteobacteria bacterium]